MLLMHHLGLVPPVGFSRLHIPVQFNCAWPGKVTRPSRGVRGAGKSIDGLILSHKLSVLRSAMELVKWIILGSYNNPVTNHLANPMAHLSSLAL